MNRKPTEGEIKELLELDVIDHAQAQELRDVDFKTQSFSLRDDQILSLVQLGKDGVVFDDSDTGSGKTVVAVKGIQYLEQAVLGHPIKSLFFSINTAKPQWYKRILSYLPEGYIDPKDIVVIGENGNGHEALRDARVAVINFERIAWSSMANCTLQTSDERSVVSKTR